jgi:hypothetical protein
MKAKRGDPWVLHTSKGCFSASHVIFNVKTETEEKPNRRCNPRYFLTCNGLIKWDGSIAIIE